MNDGGRAVVVIEEGRSISIGTELSSQQPSALRCESFILNRNIADH